MLATIRSRHGSQACSLGCHTGLQIAASVEIAKRLSPVDTAAARAVCRTWIASRGFDPAPVPPSPVVPVKTVAGKIAHGGMGITDFLGIESQLAESDRAVAAQWNHVFANQPVMGEVASGAAQTGGNAILFAGFIAGTQSALGAAGKYGGTLGKTVVGTAGVTLNSPWVAVPTTFALADISYHSAVTSYYSSQVGDYEGAIVYGGNSLMAGAAAGSIGFHTVQSGLAAPRNPNVPSAYERAVAAAKARYPNLAGQINEHHITPKYLGGASDGPTVPLDRAYHQVITNEFRSLHPYGTPKPSPATLAEIIQHVYSRFPLPPNP